MKPTKYISIFFALALFCHCGIDPVYSKDKRDIQSTKLISAEDMKTQLSSLQDEHIIIQVSKPDIYDQGHLPNALNIWRPDYGNDSKLPFAGLMASKSKIEALLNKLGVDQNSMLYLYDTKANVDALRFAWVLSYYNFNNYKIINGGLAYWQQKNFPISKISAPFPNDGTTQLGDSLAMETLANFDQVKAAIDNEHTIIIDTREDYEYLGRPFISKGAVLEYKKGAHTNGSIPSAIHMNWSTLADLNGDHRIKSEADLRYDLEKRAITPDKNIILYCQSGSRTSHTYFVLTEILGYPQVQNYDGSWIEWSYKHKLDDSVPVLKLTDKEFFLALKDSLRRTLNLPN